jgi:hypothetical protein
MSTHKIRNLETLENEILRLKLRQEEIEQTLDKNIMGFPKHLGSMALSSVMHSDLVQGIVSGNFWPQIFVRLIQNKKLQEGVRKLIDKVTDTISDGVDKVTSKIHP